VALATIHVPLRAVPALVTRQTVREKGAILAEGLRRDFGLAAPRLAVLGLNPHAGEEGHLGDEEAERIAPAVGDLRAAGIDAAGPLPADTAFHAARRGDYDAILAMYHDQGLGPLKTVAFDTGVNVTLGLPLIRTSVDHGTAFDLAGRGEAEAGSAVAALHLAVRMARLRAGGGEAGGAPSPSGA
jgi:4-hydroxythreonine-4-phosphate dehydrogenase